MSASAQSLAQLDAARNLALGDGRYYPTIIPGVLPIIGASANAALDVQRWGADFLAETFASPTWPPDVKATCALTVLPTLKEFVESQDTNIVKSAVQAAASIYPLVYRHIISDANDEQKWKLMSTIKLAILRRMGSALPGVRICCVKFVQQVVLVQTPGVTADPRRQDPNDISLTNVPRDHPLIPFANLEAEAQGLLDRLLDILHGDHSDALLVTATLNSLGVLVQRRPSVSNRILSSVLNFNPLKLANSPMTSRTKVLLRSLERTTRVLLYNVMKRNPENNINGRIQQYLERMHRMRLDVFEESNRKRPAPVEPNDGLDAAKRQRLGATVPPSTTPPVPPLPPGPVSYRQLYTLNPDASTANFDVQVFQDKEQLIRILIPVLQSINEAKLTQAVNAVRTRYNALSEEAARANVLRNESAMTMPIDDEEEYEPDFEPEDAEQVVNRLDSAPPDNLAPKPIPDGPIAPYKLPEAPPLTEQEVQRYGDETVRRSFGMLSALEETRVKGAKGGFNRLAASNFDRDAWITVISRLATRASSGLEDPEEGIKTEHNGLARKGSFTLSDTIRDGLYKYIMYDWKRRLDLAISWLNEEWYNDRLQAQVAHEAMNGDGVSILEPKGNYRRCALRLLDGITTYIEGTDKILVRFISEIPEVDREILQRMKKMAEDPERIELAIMVLQYLYMFRPPVREICVDVLEDMWRTNDRAKPSAKKFLSKWRPQVLKSDLDVKPETANGALEVKPVA